MSIGRRRVVRTLKRLTDPGTVRRSQIFRLLENFSDEALVLLLAEQQRLQSVVRLSLLKRQLVAYMKNRAMKTVLTGRDLQAMGLEPGPGYKSILGKLLDARIDGMVTTEAEERIFVEEVARRSESSQRIPMIPQDATKRLSSEAAADEATEANSATLRMLSRRDAWRRLERDQRADFFSSLLIQRGDGERHFIRQQKRHVRLVRGVRLNEGKQRHWLWHLARWQGQQNRKVDEWRHCCQAGQAKTKGQQNVAQPAGLIFFGEWLIRYDSHFPERSGDSDREGNAKFQCGGCHVDQNPGLDRRFTVSNGRGLCRLFHQLLPTCML